MFWWSFYRPEWNKTFRWINCSFFISIFLSCSISSSVVPATFSGQRQHILGQIEWQPAHDLWCIKYCYGFTTVEGDLRRIIYFSGGSRAYQTSNYWLLAKGPSMSAGSFTVDDAWLVWRNCNWTDLQSVLPSSPAMRTWWGESNEWQ